MKKNNIQIKDVNKSEALRYLGYKECNPDKKTKELLLHCEKELLETIKPNYVYKVFDLDNEKVVGTNFLLEGDSINKHLEGCSKVIFLCATLSADVDKLIRVKQITVMSEAVVIDALASVAVEQMLDQIENIIMEDFKEYEHTWRFGLGYGDFPISLQKDFLEILDAQKRISVCANESMMLVPTKSVTCVIGLGKNLKKEVRKTCDICSLRENCLYRKDGKNCGK